MSGHIFTFMGQDIPFMPGESVAAALDAAGIVRLGQDALGNDIRYFCGIGACQCCIALIDGIPREACLTPAQAGMDVKVAEVRHD